MKKLCNVFVLSFLLINSLPSAFALNKPLSARASEREELSLMTLGEKRVFTLAGASTVWIENKQILAAEAMGRSVSVKALGIGESLIRLGNRSQKIQVVHPSQMDCFSRLQKLVRNTVGLQLRFNRGQLSLDGKLYRLHDWQKIAAYDLSFQMQAALSDKLQQEAQIYFNSLFKKERLPRQNIIFSGTVEIRIHPKSIYKDKYIQLLSRYGIQTVLDEDSLEFAPTIKVQITVAEVRRDLSMSYGIKWPQGYTATLLPSGKKAYSDLIFDFKAFEKQGYGKILASPNIICRSGKEAEFLAGGEFPIKLMNYKIQDIIWKKYGVLMKVKPKADATGRMSISIDTEISTLDDARSVDGIPGILTNHVSSHFDLNKPQTIALSGLIKNEEGSGHDGVPFLSRLPVLGALFSSRDFRENRSELVVFVRPTILEDEEDSHFSEPSHSHLGDVTWK